MGPRDTELQDYFQRGQIKKAPCTATRPRERHKKPHTPPKRDAYYYVLLLLFFQEVKGKMSTVNNYYIINSSVVSNCTGSNISATTNTALTEQQSEVLRLFSMLDVRRACYVLEYMYTLVDGACFRALPSPT